MNLKNRHARAILYVDDEVMTTKWFQKTFNSDYTVYVANSADMALTLMDLHGDDVAVIISDFRMPGQNGLELLTKLNQTHPWIVKMLVTAYADKDLVLEALNQQLVYRVLEKPWDEKAFRRAVKDAFATFYNTLSARENIENSIGGMRDSLTFIAEELNIPLNVIESCLNITQNILADLDASSTLPEKLQSIKPALQASRRNLAICQKLMLGFTQSTHTAFGASEASPIQASRLVQLLNSEVSAAQSKPIDWISVDIQNDFFIESKQNLVYLCLLNIVQNAIQALQGHTDTPSIQIKLKNTKAPSVMVGHSISIKDNGPGIPSEILARITANRIANPKSAVDNHSGTGLMFCKKIMQSLRGNLSIQSNKAGTSVTLHFPFNEKDKV